MSQTHRYPKAGLARFAVRLILCAALACSLGACDSDPDLANSGNPTPNPNPNPNPNNTAPSVADQNFATDEDTPLQATIIATDAEGDTLSFIRVSGSGPVNGRLESLDSISGQFNYVPNRDFTGQDSFQVQVSDDQGGTTTATITIDVSCPNGQTQCNWDKFDPADDPALTGAREPAITVDTGLRVNVAFVEDNSPSGGNDGDLFVYQTAILGRSFSKLAGSGVNGALNDNGPAARPDLMASLVLPTTVVVSWDEGDDIVIEARNDLSGAWSDVSGAPNTDPARDPSLTLDPITGSPILVWTGNPSTSNGDVRLATNTGFGTLMPGNWQGLNAPLESSAANDARRPAITSDDVPGGGTNVFGRNTIAFQETIAGVDTVQVRQCANAGSGNAAACTALGGALNPDPALDSGNPAITIPNAATALLIGEDPTSPRPVVALVQAGQLFVLRFEPGSNQWLTLADAANANGALNAGGTAGIASDPAIVTDVLGRYTVVWSELNPASGRQGIYAKRLDATGNGVWTGLGTILNCDPEMPARAPDIAVDTLGIPYIAFEEDDASGDTRIVVMSFES